jgi:hypothetical protein
MGCFCELGDLGVKPDLSPVVLLDSGRDREDGLLRRHAEREIVDGLSGQVISEASSVVVPNLG